MKDTNVVYLCTRRAFRGGHGPARCLTLLLEDELPYPWHTVEHARRDGEAVFTVYGWRTAPHARRARAPRAKKQNLATFPTLREALAAYPDAKLLAPVVQLGETPEEVPA